MKINITQTPNNKDLNQGTLHLASIGINLSNGHTQNGVNFYF